MISLICLSSSAVTLTWVAPKFSSRYLENQQGSFSPFTASSRLDGQYSLDALCAGDRNDIVTLIHEPRKGELSRCAILGFGEFLDTLDQLCEMEERCKH